MKIGNTRTNIPPFHESGEPIDQDILHVISWLSIQLDFGFKNTSYNLPGNPISRALFLYQRFVLQSLQVIPRHGLDRGHNWQ